jgi:hypothetical protein
LLRSSSEPKHACKYPIWNIYFVSYDQIFATNDCITSPLDIVRLWCHETHRVYMDKLADNKVTVRSIKLHFGHKDSWQTGANVILFKKF